MHRTVVDWILTTKCNLDCYYCLMGKSKNSASEILSVDSSFLKSAKGSFLFHLTGGEPFLLPNWVELCQAIQQAGGMISVNTNLTHSVEHFVYKVDPDLVAFINCSVHYWLRKEHMRPFRMNYEKLRNAGFFAYATLLMIPEIFDEMTDFFWKWADTDILILPKVMRGRSNGVNYPEGYTRKQKEEIREMIEYTKARLTDEERKHFEMMNLYSVSADDWNTALVDQAAKPCFDGVNFIRMTENGDILYCIDHFLGNVQRDGLKTLETINKCEYRKCVGEKFLCGKC